MRFILQLSVIIVAGFILELFLPWWSIAIAAFLGGVALKSKANFLAGFLGIALLWFIKALIIDLNNTSALAEKVANIFPLHSKPLLFLVMVILGGLVGGFAAMTGAFLKK
jgi:hypothetical protein